MKVELSVFAQSGEVGEGSQGELYMDFSQQGLGVTPEPSSILLLMPGLAGVMFATKSRLRKAE
jgi:hypothetical protein